MKKILVVNDLADCGAHYGSPFRKFAETTTDLELIHRNPESLLAAVFTGGADVEPSFYNHKKHPRTFSNPSRDVQERKIYSRLEKLGIPLFGICRGAQFLCVMAGGTLVQHLDNHAGYHDMRLLHEDRTIQVNSTHHQMQVPPSDAVVLGVALPRLSKGYIYTANPQFYPEHEYEVVYYPSINALGAQYHPEAMSIKSDGYQYYQTLIEKHLNGQLPKK